MRLARTAWLAFLWLGFLAIGSASLSYIEEGDVHPFILEKLPLPHAEVWVAALYAHVVSALFALPACLLLISRALLRRAPRAHRWLGRVNGAVVLLVLVPSGSYLALFAKGGVWGSAGFLLSAAITAAAMVKAIQHARAGELGAHRRAALHVLGQMSVAVVSRTLIVGLDALGAPEDLAYVAALWVPVLLSAAVVERMFWRSLGTGRRSHDREAALVLSPVR